MRRSGGCLHSKMNGQYIRSLYGKVTDEYWILVLYCFGAMFYAGRGFGFVFYHFICCSDCFYRFGNFIF